MGKIKFRTKRGYVGRRRTRIKKHAIEEIPQEHEPSPEARTTKSVSSRKLSAFGINLENSSDQQCKEGLDMSDCYMIIQKMVMARFLKALACPVCKQSDLDFVLSENRRCGFSMKAAIYCNACEKKVFEDFLCQRINDSSCSSQAFDINLRATVAFRGIGCGLSAINEWSGLMNMPYSLSNDGYANCYQKIEEAVSETFKEISKTTRSEVENAYADIGVTPDSDGVLDISVSFDGSWQKRGHTSHNGMASVIDLLTGLPIDYEILSNFCFKCKAMEGKEVEESWVQKHANNCSKNFEGSAGAMEVETALRLWRRSVAQHKFRYRTMLCDGDSKSFDAVVAENVYGDLKIEKEDCINHVSKRMGTALRNLVQCCKAEKVSISGKGKLTQEKMRKIQNYYGRAIKDYSGDISLLQSRIMAIVLHLSSTDKLPKHSQCPPGIQSWCFWQRALANQTVPGSHSEHETLPPEVGRRLVPIFRRLSEEGLLKRCAQHKTQNANESLHNLVWRICPKINFVGKRTFKTAVGLAICNFGMGASSKGLLFKALNMQTGIVLERTIHKENVKRIRKAERAADESTKKRRRDIKYKKQKNDEEKKQKEGELYSPGSFNI